MKQWLKSFVHPMMMFMPVNMAHKFHDNNANWAFGSNRYDEIKLEMNLAKFERVGDEE